MSRIRYADIYERYYFGGRQALGCLPDGKLTISSLSPEVQQRRVDWLDGEPRLVVVLKSSWRRSSVAVSSTLSECATRLRVLPVGAERLRAANAAIELRDMCRSVYGADSRMHVLVDLKLYCTVRSLRAYRSENVTRVTPANVNQVIQALVHGEVADDPDYILQNGPAYAWYYSGRPIGFAGVHSSAMSDEVGNVGMVFVEDAYRGRGIAKALVASVAESLLSCGRVPVYGCFEDNAPSVGAALGAGFLFKGYGVRIFVS